MDDRVEEGGMLAAIVRRPGGPVPLGIVRTADPDWSRDQSAAAALVAGGVPLRLVEGAARREPAVAAVDRAWAALADARITPESLAALLLILLRTTLDEPVPSGISRFDGAEAAPPFRPTAAHPRAYEGTGARPPKVRSPRRFDLRTVALDPRASRALVERFPAEVEAALARLAEPDRPRACLALSREPDGAPGWDGAALPGDFRRLVWPHLRFAAADLVPEVLGAFRRHSPAVSRSLAAAAAWWLARGPVDEALEWLRAALALPSDRAAMALFVCAETEAREVPAGLIPLQQVAEATAEDSGAFVFELRELLDGRRSGVEATLLVPGLELSRGVRPRWSMGAEWPVELVPAEPVRRLASEHAGERWPQVAADLWAVLARTPGMAGVVLAQPWSEIDRSAAEEILRTMAYGWRDDGPNALSQRWMEHLPGIVELLRGRPAEYAGKVTDTLSEAVYVWLSPTTLRELWPWLAPVASRLGAPPFKPGIRSFLVWNNLLEHATPELRRAVAGAPERLWIELERRCRVPAQTTLLSRGFDAIGAAHGVRLVETFLCGTPLLYEVATLVGGMSDSSAQGVCRSVGEAADPVAWLRRLRDRALEDLGRGLRADVSRPAVRHALLLQRSLADNRRALRKFLRAHMDGEAEYVARHPLTRRWLVSHPAVDARRWTRGIALDATVAEMGALALRVEADPLEALRLGTYVGSCLSVRGLCDYSAVAVALDVNKQVVYARNRRGSVVARQLLALSEEGEMVAFAVYPLSAPAAVRRLFARYDRAFAAELGLPLRAAAEGAADYTIAEVISSRWWDDGAWESSFRPSSEAAGA